MNLCCIAVSMIIVYLCMIIMIDILIMMIAICYSWMMYGKRKKLSFVLKLA
jgi:hypothetical protein